MLFSEVQNAKVLLPIFCNEVGSSTLMIFPVVSDGKSFAGALSYSLPIIILHIIFLISILNKKKSSRINVHVLYNH